MTKPKNPIKTYVTLFSFTTIFTLAGCLTTMAQSTPPHFDARILPSLEKLVTIGDVESLQEQLDRLQKQVFKDSKPDKGRTCEALFNFVVFRYRLHRTSTSLPGPPGTASWEHQKEVQGVIRQNVFKAEELYAKGEKECPTEGDPTEPYLMARFVNAWLFDNATSDFGLGIGFKNNRAILAKRAERVLNDYDYILKEYRSRSDKSWIDPVVLWYSYATALLRSGNIEAAELLLSEGITVAANKYGMDSPALLPLLRYLSAIAACAGDQAGSNQYLAQINRIETGSAKSEELFFDLRGRATPESKLVFAFEQMLQVSGPRQEIEGKESKLRNVNTIGDLPFSAGVILNFPPDGSLSVTFPMEVFITVNEAGDVTDASVLDLPEKVRAILKKTALGLKFKPLTYKGRATSMRGYVKIYIKYSYTD